MSLFRRFVILVLVLALVPLVLSVLYNVINPVSTLMLGRWLTGQRVERVWTPIGDMAPILPRTVIA
ncbi:MAG: monofunctional biosynthetic peptidoglycan transglycosylase, partial [Pseudomonadota bacterium]